MRTHLFFEAEASFSSDTITDFRTTGVAHDILDLTAFDIIAAASDLAEWLAENVLQQENGDVSIRLSNAQSVLVEDHLGLGEDLVGQLMECILI